MHELRGPVSGRHRGVHLTIWALTGVLLASFLLPPILGTLLVLFGGGSD